MASDILSRRILDAPGKSHSKYARQEPWLHYVVDGFFDASCFPEIQRQIIDSEQDFSILPDDEHELQFKLLSNIKLARAFYSLQFYNFISSFSDDELSLNEKSLVQLRYADGNTPAFPRHVDTPTLGRSLVVIVYISPGWLPRHGGRLCLHKAEDSTPETDRYVDPLENRLVAFFTDAKNWHSVEKVTDWARYSIMSEWLCKPA